MNLSDELSAGGLGTPELDWQANRLTGIGREHWAAIADNLLVAVRPFASADHSSIDLPGRPSVSGVRADGLEGFARTFLLAAIRVAGDQGADPHGHLDFYRRGLLSGTAPSQPGQRVSGSPEHWPPIRSATAGGQPMVESASIALALHLTRPWLWDRLAQREQSAVEAWLREALRHEPAPNNWFVFPLTVASFLEAIGHADDETRSFIARALTLLEGWYHGDGWYSDGDGRAFDHYVGWTMHAYPMIFAFLRSDPVLLERFGPRLQRFLEDFCETFDDNGAPIYQGRSLTYRFAALAAPALGVLTGYSPLDSGQSRTLASRTLKYFLSKGAVVDGVLSLGWHGPHAATVQGYSGPASPYWGSNGFLLLLLGKDDPFWSAPEKEPRSDSMIRPIVPVGWLVHRTADGIARLHNHGSDHIGIRQGESGMPNPLYSRFAYSTRTGPTQSGNASDNDCQLVIGSVASSRHRIHPLGTGSDWAASWHTPVFADSSSSGFVLPQARIDSLVIAHGDCDVRVYRLHCVPEGTPIRLSGWAIAALSPADITTRLSESPENPENLKNPTISLAHVHDGLVSGLVGLQGFTSAQVDRAPGGTAFGRWALVPTLRGVTKGKIFAACARVSAGADLATSPPEVRSAGQNSSTLTLAWNDGEHLIEWTTDGPSVRWITG